MAVMAAVFQQRECKDDLIREQYDLGEFECYHLIDRAPKWIICSDTGVVYPDPVDLCPAPSRISIARKKSIVLFRVSIEYQ
jgi:hypothetical protein